MPIRVKVVDHRFNVLDEADLTDDLLRLLLADESPVRQLRYIDEYGDTYFNSLQVRDALPELEALRHKAGPPCDRTLLERLIQLALLAVERPHRFLTFEGD